MPAATEMRTVTMDGSPATAEMLLDALRDALAGGAPVRPVPCAPPPPPLPAPPRPGTALVISTSGSTGTAKHVELGAEALLASAEATHQRLGGRGRWLLAMPAVHIAGVQVLVRSLAAGMDPVIAQGAGGFRAEDFDPGNARYTALVPTQLARLLEHPAATERLAALSGVLVGGAAAPQQLLERAERAGVRVLSTYGSSETAGGCVYSGTPLGGVDVAAPEGAIEVAGPTLALGYLGDPGREAEAFVQRGGRRWYRTGDIGEWDGNTLRVLGRSDDLINTGGVKVAPAAVERILCSRNDIAEACVVGIPDLQWGQAVVVMLVGRGASIDQPAAEAAVRDELGAAAVPKQWRRADSLPLRGPGKVDRSAVAAAFADRPEE